QIGLSNGSGDQTQPPFNTRPKNVLENDYMNHQDMAQCLLQSKFSDSSSHQSQSALLESQSRPASSTLLNVISPNAQTTLQSLHEAKQRMTSLQFDDNSDYAVIDCSSSNLNLNGETGIAQAMRNKMALENMQHPELNDAKHHHALALSSENLNELGSSTDA